jgi:hypothetical protein
MSPPASCSSAILSAFDQTIAIGTLACHRSYTSHDQRQSRGTLPAGKLHPAARENEFRLPPNVSTLEVGCSLAAPSPHRRSGPSLPFWQSRGQAVQRDGRTGLEVVVSIGPIASLSGPHGIQKIEPDEKTVVTAALQVGCSRGRLGLGDPTTVQLVRRGARFTAPPGCAPVRSKRPTHRPDPQTQARVGADTAMRLLAMRGVESVDFGYSAAPSPTASDAGAPSRRPSCGFLTRTRADA